MNNFLLTKKQNFVLLLFALFTTTIFAQTTIINPATVGGFESGTTFALNGWTNTSGTATQNQWVVNTGATSGYSGARCAYVSQNRGATPPPFTYDTGTTRATHFYRNITVPAGETDITLSFNWLGQGESSYDKMRVWVVPTSYTPAYGTAITSTGTAPTGRIQVGATNYSVQGSWTSTSFKLPTAYAGTTVRLVFEWTNDASLGTQPPAAIDNISLTSAILVAPANDLCANATLLPCGTSNLAGTTVATTNVAHGTGCTMSNYGVWYTFIGDGNITTISTNPAFDIKLSVATGSCGSLTNIVCTDSSPETATFSTTNGVNYYVYVAHYSTSGSTTGTFTISRTCSAPIANDNCSGAVNVTVNPTRTCTATTAGTLFGATDSGVTGSTCGGTDDDDVWFSFVATSTTHHIELLNVAGSTTDLYHAVYSGTCGTLGSALLCSDPDTSVITGLTPGNTYYLQVYSWTSTTGQNSTFDVCISTDPPCTTPAAQASGFTSGTVTSTAFPASFSGTADSYLVIRSTSATPPSQPVNGVVYTAANIGTLGAGLTFVQNGTATTIAGTGLNGNTRYYYYIYAYNNTNCSGGPLYNASGALTGNAVTCPASPSPVTTSATLNSINFSWPSSIGGGINAVSYQLQVTTDVGYTINVLGSPFTINDPTITYNLTGLTANTTYYYRIRANNGCWSPYTTGTATTGYCVATNSTNTTYYISGITTTGGVANINNTPTGFTAGGYANYTAMVVSQNAGLGFNITATHPSSTYGYTVWVDWNNDLDFDDVGETVLSTGYVATPAALGTVTIPGGTAPGNYRMRIRNAFLSNPAPSCGDFAYGEAEDYTITVLVPAPCSGTPTGGTVSTSPNTGWPGSTYTVSASGYTYASNMTYQWQYSTDAGATWTNAGAATTSYSNYTATAPASGDVHWQLIVTCTNSSQSATSSTAVFVTMTVSVVETGCPNVVSGGLGLSGSDPAPITCISPSGCVDLEATYLDLGETTSYIVEPIAYNPPFSFSGLANPVSVNTDDVWSPVVNLPFDFCFYGNTYNQCVIGSNGILTFNTALAGGSSGYSFANNIPISGDPRLIENSIFGVFHDINPGVGGEVGWELITLPSGCRALVASWSDVPMFDENSILYTGMMVLYENSNIIEVYIQEKNIDNFGAGTWNDGNAVVGIQNSTGTLASVPPGRNGLDANWAATNEAWRFVPNGNSIASITWYEGSGVSGTVVGTTDVINVCPASTTIYTAEITYTLCDGRTITELDETTVTVNKDKTWNGSTSTNWNTASNWTPAGVPVITESVFIPNVTNDPIIGAGADALACSLNVETGAVLTINSGRNLVVTNGITVATGGTLNIQNTANLVQVNDAAINSGNINMERITNVRLQDYSYWSSPVESFPVQNVSPLTPAANIFEWGTTAPNANGGEGTWLNTSESMIPAKGYILRAPAGFTNASTSPLTANFVGVPNNGVFTPTIFRGTDYITVGTQGMLRTITDDNWNLIGNPYPSALGVNEFLTFPSNNTIVGGIRIWTHGQLPTNAVDPFYQDFITNYYPSDYITINLTGATSGPGDYKIGSGQGFMVLMNPGTPGSSSVTFNNSMRSASFANNQFYRNSTIENNADTIEQNRIWLDLVGSTGAVNRMLVGYVTNATQDEDALYDSFTDYKPSQNFYSLIGNDPMSIQGRALPFNVNDRVNLGVTIPQEGTYNIAISALDGLFETTNQNIYIEDLENNIIHNLKDSPYTFSASEGNITDRFVLRYTENRLSNNDLEDSNNNIFVITNDHLTVKSTSLKIKSIIIHDILGRIISNKKNVNSNEISFGNIQKSNTTLLLRIELDNGSFVTKKVIF